MKGFLKLVGDFTSLFDTRRIKRVLNVNTLFLKDQKYIGTRTLVLFSCELQKSNVCTKFEKLDLVQDHTTAIKLIPHLDKYFEKARNGERYKLTFQKVEDSIIEGEKFKKGTFKISRGRSRDFDATLCVNHELLELAFVLVDYDDIEFCVFQEELNGIILLLRDQNVVGVVKPLVK